MAVKQQGVLSEADAAAKAAAEELRLAKQAADEREAELKAELDASYATMAACRGRSPGGGGRGAAR